MDSDYEVMPIKYLDCYPNLPVDAPVGHPHIIDTDSIDHEFARSQNMTIADAVVTILFKYMPGALTAFLDLERPHFHYIQAGRVARLDFCIKRDRRAVTVGVRVECSLLQTDEKLRLDSLTKGRSAAGMYNTDTTSMEKLPSIGIPVGAE